MWGVGCGVIAWYLCGVARARGSFLSANCRVLLFRLSRPLCDLILLLRFVLVCGDLCTRYCPPSGKPPVLLRCSMHESDITPVLGARPRSVSIRRGAAEMGRRLVGRLVLRRMPGWTWVPPEAAHPKHHAARAKLERARADTLHRAELVEDSGWPAEFVGMELGETWGHRDPDDPNAVIFLTLPNHPDPKPLHLSSSGDHAATVEDAAVQGAWGGTERVTVTVGVMWSEEQPLSMNITATTTSDAPQCARLALDEGASEALLVRVGQAMWAASCGAPAGMGVESVLLWLQRCPGAIATLAERLAPRLVVAPVARDAEGETTWTLVCDG